MKKWLYLMILCLFLPFLGCSDSSDAPDPLMAFRQFSEKNRELVYSQFIQAGREYAALLDDDPAEADYLVANEDLYVQYFYLGFIFNTVISFDVESWNGNTYTGNNGDSTITIANGIYTLQSRYYMDLDNGMERLDIRFAWNSTTARWLITGTRTPVPADGSLPQTWIRQEGEWLTRDTACTAATFFIDEEDGLRHVGNTRFTYGAGQNNLSMALERELCLENCVDLEAFDLYDLGVVAVAGGSDWVDFKAYRVMDDDPDYEIPPVEEPAK